MSELGQILMILASAAFGGAGVKIIDSLIKRYRAKIDSTAQIRQELRDEAESLRLENYLLIGELEEWRMKYFDLMKRFNEQKVEIHRMQIEQQYPNVD